MKKINITLFVLSVIVFSCKKDKKEDEIDPNKVIITATLGEEITDFDGNKYNTVIITKCGQWMTSNLKTAHFANGDTIYSGRHLGDISSETDPKYFFYPNGDSLNIKNYGRLYTYYVVSDSRNVCPSGWRIPTKNDWDTLNKYFGGQEISAGHFKSSSFWASPNIGADNTSKLSIVGAGLRRPDNTQNEFNKTGIFWTSTADTSDRIWHASIKYNYPTLFQASSLKNFSFSVRCMHD